MSVDKDMAAGLLEQERMHTGGDPNERLREVRKMIEKQTKQLRQMKWVVIGLWVASIVGLLITAKLGTTDRLLVKGDRLVALDLYVRIFAQYLPLVATVSTVVYFIRRTTWSGRADRREIAARLESIERALERIAEK